MDDPNWPRAASWLTSQPQSSAATALAVIGVPLNRSITPGRCDLAPPAIRKALARYSTYDIDLQTDVMDLVAHDLGDISTEHEPIAAIRERVGAASAAILLGGDNGVTRFGVHSLGVPLSDCGLITFDAHHDVRDVSNGPHNGNPIRGLLEDGLPGANIVQIGIQPFANSRVYSEFALSSGITIVTADEVEAKGIDTIVARALAHLAKAMAVYVDLDVDVLDRAFAPACPGSRPGGLTPRMVRQAARLCGKAPIVKMMDLVEIDPTKDIAETTVLAAASFLLAFASGLTARLDP